MVIFRPRAFSTDAPRTMRRPRIVFCARSQPQYDRDLHAAQQYSMATITHDHIVALRVDLVGRCGRDGNRAGVV